VKRYWIWIFLLLSLGVNLGLFSILLVHRLTSPAPPPLAAGEWEPGGGGPGGEGPDGEGPPGGVPPAIGRLADHLELEGETRERFITLQRNFFITTRQRRQQMEGLHRELRRELTDRQPDRGRVEEILARMEPLYGDFERSMVDLVLDTRELLSPRQQWEYLRILERLTGAARRPGGPPPGPGMRGRNLPPRPGFDPRRRPGGPGPLSGRGGPGEEAQPEEVIPPPPPWR